MTIYSLVMQNDLGNRILVTQYCIYPKCLDMSKETLIKELFSHGLHCLTSTKTFWKNQLVVKRTFFLQILG